MTTPTAEPPALTGPPKLPALAVVSHSFRMVRDHPRESMLPLLVIQVPAAAIGGIVTALLYFTVFADEKYAATEGGPLLALLLVSAFEGLFAQIARAGTIVSITGVATGKPKSLSESLDPAFTRMGQMIVLVAILAAGFFLGIVSIIGVILLPYLVLRVALSFETFILEDLGPWAAIKRAWTLSTGNVLRLLGLIILTFLAVLAPFVAIQSLALVGGGSRTEEIILGSIFAFVQGVLLIPLIAFLTASTTLFYLNLVGRFDG